MSDESLTALLQAQDDLVRERALLVKGAIALGATQAAREHGVSWPDGDEVAQPLPIRWRIKAGR